MDCTVYASNDLGCTDCFSVSLWLYVHVDPQSVPLQVLLILSAVSE